MPLIEACVETLEEALAAQAGGANRIELCSHLEEDGLSPSNNLLKQVCLELHIPVMVMVRPRPGNFVYSREEIRQMQKHIVAARQAGASGIVLGCLHSLHQIDIPNTQLLAHLAYPLPVTFHKAIDLTADPVLGVLQLKKIFNIKRILTSGGKSTALEGVETLRQMIAAAAPEITIVAAGKVNTSNLTRVQQLTGASEFHGRKIVS